MRIRYFLLFVIALLSNTLAAQERKRIWDHKLVKRFTSSTKDSTRSGGFVVVPALGYAQETGLEFGLAAVYNFYLNRADTTIRTSNITFIGTFTTQRQTNLKLETDFWSPGNLYHYYTEIRYRDFPYNFYGIGNETFFDDENPLGMQLIRLRGEVERRLAPAYYAGLTFNFERYAYTDLQPGGVFEQLPLMGREGGSHAIFGVSQLYDTRNINTYTTDGYFARVKYGYSPGFGREGNFKGSQIDVDLRAFYPLSKSFTLGLNALYKTTFGDNVPFYTYREMGGDMMMRGYYMGRYRDRSYLAAQTELRYRFHPRLGIVGFAGAGTTYRNGLANTRFVPSIGGGLRYFYDLEHNGSIRIDYGSGERRPGEKRQSGFYLSISEAF